jgi:hypothetical protein
MIPFSQESRLKPAEARPSIYDEQMASEKQAGGMSTAAVALAAAGSVLAASSCCLPVLPFALAAGFAGGSAVLSAARPYLLGASVLFIAFGFYQARQARKCRRKPGVAAPILLWMSALFVAFSVFFPEAMANVAADVLSRGSKPAPAGQPPLVSLTPANLAGIRDAFNAAIDDIRVLVFLSPT